MANILKLSCNESAWVDFPYMNGVSVELVRENSPAFKSAFLQELAKLDESEIKEIQGRTDTGVELSNIAYINAASSTLVRNWEGVSFTDDDEPVECNEDNVRLLMEQVDMFREWVEEQTKLLSNFQRKAVENASGN